MKINEEAFLKKLTDIIDDPDIKKTALDELEKRSYERKLLEKFENALGLNKEKLQAAQEQLQELEAIEITSKTTLREDIPSQAVLPVSAYVTPPVQKLMNTSPQDYEKMVSKMKAGLQKEIDLIKKTVVDLHQFATSMSNMGGGGGAGDVISLDHPAKTIYTNYTFTRKDYYVGAGVTPVTITLPSTAKNGRCIIIKDEVGNCSANPITVLGNVDNDAGGFILAQNNGGIQMLYNNGSWRIV
jgi:hypothetical protein